MSKTNTVVIFHYFEKSEEYKDNLAYFLRRGYRADVDYIICISGGCSVPLPQARNISYHYVPNGCSDYDGHSHVVNNILNVERYDFFIFLNSSVRGPFLPSYFNGAWPRVFTDLIDDQTKLVGATINILGKKHQISRISECLNGSQRSLSHVQSAAYAMDCTALRFLVQKRFFQNEIVPDDALTRAWAKVQAERGSLLPSLYWSLRHRLRCMRSPRWAAQRAAKFAAILKYEISLSQTIIENGWNITCLLPEYRTIDFRRPHEDMNRSSVDGDPCFRGAYCGRSIHPFETVFIKTGRDIVDSAYLKSLEASQTVSAGNEASAYQASPFDLVLGEIQSAWKGHTNFATWLVTTLKPGLIVDLGVDFGFSTFCFARPNTGEVVGVDSFEGDIHAGKRDTYTQVQNTISQLGLSNITLIRGRFDEVAQTWDKRIGILHIDGCHTYDAAKKDYETWSNFVAPNGVVLLHDTCVPGFGVRRLFNEVKLPKTNFANSFGLGVISKNKQLISEIAAIFSSQVEPGTTALEA